MPRPRLSEQERKRRRNESERNRRTRLRMHLGARQRDQADEETMRLVHIQSPPQSSRLSPHGLHDTSIPTNDPPVPQIVTPVVPPNTRTPTTAAVRPTPTIPTPNPSTTAASPLRAAENPAFRQDHDPETVLPSVEEIFSQIREGNFDSATSSTLESHPAMDKAGKKFLRMMMQPWHHCSFCKERGPHVKLRRDSQECFTCCKSRRTKNQPTEIRKFSRDNQMDPFPGGYPFHLPKLSVIEEQMISRVHTTFRCYRLPGGQQGYSGSAINLEKKDLEFLTTLPQRVENLPVCIIVRRSHPRIQNGHKDFRVRRDAILRWLLFLRGNNPLYSDIQVDYQALQELPQDDNVGAQVRVVEEEDEPNNSDSVDDDAGGDNEPQMAGPDQSGATGQFEEDIDVVREYVAQSINRNTTADPQSYLIGTTENPIAFPETGELINDFNAPNLQASAFPTLFPYGVGDVTNRDRPKEVSMSDANKHLLWYAVPTNADGDAEQEYLYPFASHEQWCYWAQNTDERHRFQSQKRVYISRSPAHTALTTDDFNEILRSNNAEALREITGRMQMFSQNILGSDSYFGKHRKQLEALMEQKGMPTFWFTFSAADNHWADLHNIFGGNEEENDDSNQDARAKKRRKQVRENPHITDEFVYARIQAMLETYFAEFGCEWVWFRIEYQKRGTPHIHGCCRLKSAPDLCKLGPKVSEGRQAQRRLQASNLDLPECHFSFEDTHEDEFKEECPPKRYNEEEIELMQASVSEGVKAQHTITVFNDYLISTTHPRPPTDAESNERDDSTLFRQTAMNTHPSASRPDFWELPADERAKRFSDGIDAVERHKCCSYCTSSSNKKCRGSFPQQIRAKTIVAVKQHVKKKNNGTEETTTRLELLTKRNDRFLNSHCRPLFECWLANVDMRLTIDVGKIVSYMTKYVTKTETTHTPRTKRLFFSTLRRLANENDDTSVLLKKMMTQLHGQRVRSKQETCHLINHTPLVYCTHSFRRVNLRNDASLVSATEDTTIQTKTTIIDVYAKRLEPDVWLDGAVPQGIAQCSLNEFVNSYTVSLLGRFAGKIKPLEEDSLTVMQFTPNLPNGRGLPTYPEYCRLSLVRYRAWHGNYFNAFDGENATDDEMIRTWETYLQTLPEPPDSLRQELNTLMASNIEEDTDMHGGNGGAEEEEIEGDIEQLEYSYLGVEQDVLDDGDNLDMAWSEEHEFSLTHDYSFCVQNFETLIEEMKEAQDPALQEDTEIPYEVHRDELNEKQRLFLDTIDILTSYDETESSTDGGSGLSRCVILRGRGGSGKSHTTNCLRSELGEAVSALATTGKAATVIWGSTVFNKKSGLALPVGRKTKCTPLQGRHLQELQRTWKNKKIVLLDEYSMLDQRLLECMNQRCQEAKASTRLFGGLIVVLIGDTAQLPPVQGLPLWSQKRNVSSESLSGMFLYFNHFTTVVELTVNTRLDFSDVDATTFHSFLNRLADGECTQDDWKLVRDKCSFDTIGPTRWGELGFEGPDVIYLFPTNLEVQKHNLKRLRLQDQPVARINAENSSARAKQLSGADHFRGLQNTLYICVNARVYVTKNIWPEKGLSNGSTGLVKDIDFAEGAPPPALPRCIWVDFGLSYTGPRFFPNDETRSGWVPILPSTETTHLRKKDSADWEDHSRTMPPLRTAWAWTIWKAQGQTLKNKVVINLGKKEAEHGLSYVAFSRVTRFSDLGIIGGLSGTRLTSQIAGQTKLKHRKEEDRRLRLLAAKTEERVQSLLS